MVRIYRLMRVVGGAYSTIDFYLDPSAAAAAALRESRTLDARDYVIVSQVDVYPKMSEIHEFLRVDGLNASRSRTR